MLRLDPSKRIAMQAVLKDPWFKMIRNQKTNLPIKSLEVPAAKGVLVRLSCVFNGVCGA